MHRYFNFVAPEGAGYFVYDDLDTKKVLARVFFRGKNFGEVTSIDQALCTQSGPWSTHIVGSQHDLSWSLDFKQHSAQDATASVAGTLTIAGRPVPITGVGLVEDEKEFHLPNANGVLRAFYHDPKLSFLYHPEISQVKYNNEPLILRNINHDATGDDIRIKSDNYELAVATSVVQEDKFHINTYVPSLAVAQQLVRYRGVLRHQGKKVYSFNGLGFQEHSSKNWLNSGEREI